MKTQAHKYSKNSFKIVSKKLIIAFVLAVSFSSFAQEQNQADKKSKNAKREQMTPEQRNQALLDRMTTQLTLTPQQQEQIKPIIAEQTAKMEVIRAERMNGNSKKMTKEEREAFRTKRKEDKKASDAKLQSILTPEQFKKMKENEQAAREKMRESRGNWQNSDHGGARGNENEMGGNNDDN